MYTVAFVQGSKLVSVSTPSIAYAASVASYIRHARVWYKDRIVPEAVLGAARIASDNGQLKSDTVDQLMSIAHSWAHVAH